MPRPAPIHVGPYRATPIRARGDLWYWKVTEGGARGRDVSALLPSRWASVEIVTSALRAALVQASAPVRWTVAELLGAWLKMAARPGESPRTTAARAEGAGYLLADDLAAVDVDELAEADLLAARQRLLVRYASSTVAASFERLASAWRWARDEGAVNHNLPRVRVQVRPHLAKPIPRADELRPILDRLQGWHRVAFLLLVETGARVSEIGTLTRERCDLRQGVIRVCGKLTRRISPTATRAIPLVLDGEALAALRNYCADRLPGPLWTGANALRLAIYHACDLAGARRLSPNAFRRRADILLMDAGELSALPALMDHSLAEASKTYALPEAPALRAAAARLQIGATQVRDTSATQANRKRR